ncbi:DUF1320 family protein [Sphingomonas sp. AOB5]|uniref:phage protein Gp36 family protein n=1 Tax=Sphingomonas sp. AOB5 TaxID=3034017 RepID=UPI0023FA2CDB|nr:phage protein Gp36 family protein [Sphingomonas sp. AOB5]MDF7776874.1 DUF1320 family protein [Sphingomonas sp. AOB5]
MYATADDMRAEYGEQALVQLANAPSWDATVIAKVELKLATAAAEIDGYVAKVHAQAMGIAVPPLLRAINLTLAFAAMHSTRTEDVKDREAEVRRQLREIRDGILKLDEGRGDLPARDGAVIVPSRDRVFSRDTLGSF